MKYTIEKISKEWDHSVKSIAALFHKFEIYGSNSECYQIKNKGGNLVGEFYIFKKSKLGKSYLITPPYSSNIGLNIINEATNPAQVQTNLKQITKVVADFLSEQNSILIEIVLPQDIKDAQAFQWKKFETSIKYTYLLDLNQSEEILLSNMSPERRKNIKKSVTDHIEIKSFNDPDQIISWSEQTLSNNNASFDIEIIKNIVKKFADTEHLVCKVTYMDSLPISMALCIKTDFECIYLFSWKNKEAKNESAGAFALWNCIIEAKASGCSIFDFAGSDFQAIERFFRGFGGALTPMIQLKKVSSLGKIALKLKK